MDKSLLSLYLVDPKRVELSRYSKCENLAIPIAFEYEDGVNIILNLIDEMEARYEVLEENKMRDLAEYNDNAGPKDRYPYCVLIIEEFADYILRSKIEQKKKEHKPHKTVKRRFTKERFEEIYEADVEMLLTRLAQMGRAAGIHMILATQRPSVDVVSGLIKANIPTRIALTTSSPTDSQVILGQLGAEKLAGKGDLLLMSPGQPLRRLQGFSL